MNGAHHQRDQHPVRSVLISVLWLLALAGFIGICLLFAGSRFQAYTIIAVQGTVAVVLARRLALDVLRNRAPSPAVLADWIDDAALVAAWLVVVLTSIGQSQGWMHGALRWAVLGLLGLFAAGMPAYWWRGKRRVVQALTARALAGQWPWPAGTRRDKAARN